VAPCGSGHGDATQEPAPPARATRSLGQNFLTDEAILRNIVAAAGVTANDVVLEVGPGTGNLTRHLVATGAQVRDAAEGARVAARLPSSAAGRFSLGRSCFGAGAVRCWRAQGEPNPAAYLGMAAACRRRAG
jgi:hypothetical protein